MQDIRKSSRFIVIILVTLLLVITSGLVIQRYGPARSGKTGIWFNDLQRVKPPDKEASRQAAAYIFERIRDPEGVGDSPAALVSYTSPSIVFISISDGEHQARVWQGRGTTLELAVEDALEKLSPAIDHGLEPAWIKVDFARDVTPARKMDLDGVVTEERSLYGLAFDEETGYAFLPEELVSHTLVDSQANIRMDNIEEYLAEQRGDLTQITRLLYEDTVTIYRFATQGYFSDGTQVWSLYRGHRLHQTYTTDELLAAATAGGRYLTEAVDENGQFDYSYFPKSDTLADDYNIIRHAGTIYAMMELYELTRDQVLLDAAERAIDYLLASAEDCPTPGGPETCVMEDGEASLGGNGLSMLALTKYMTATGSRKYLPQVQSMGRWILSIQNPDGEFFIHILDMQSGERVDFVSEYYPGEALFALARLYQFDGDETWKEAAENGARWLITVRDGDKSDDELPHDHWLLYALNEIYRFRGDSLFLDYAMRMAGAITDSQHLDPEYEDWAGSYYEPPRSTPTATRSEGLYAAYQLARDFGTPEQADEILTALRHGVLFQLGTQFQPESVMYLSDPARSLGGFHRELTNYEIRIDYVQHNISSILGLYSIEGGTP